MKTRLTSTKRVLLFAICFAAIAIFTVPGLFLCEIVEREPLFAVGVTVGLTAFPAGFLVLLFAQPGKPDTGWFLWLIGIHVFFFGSCLAFGWLVYVTGLAVAAEPGWTICLNTLGIICSHI